MLQQSRAKAPFQGVKKPYAIGSGNAFSEKRIASAGGNSAGPGMPWGEYGMIEVCILETSTP